MQAGLCSTQQPSIGQIVAYFAVNPGLAVQSKSFVVLGRQHLWRILNQKNSLFAAVYFAE